MIPPRKERKRQERIDPKNPRSKEDKPWRHCTQIIIEPAEFPPHIKPAALIIGTKGSNHARLQDESGCCIQLRGIGISSPGTPGSNEPLHLFVKYDDISQLNKLNQALRQLIQTAFLRASGTADRPPTQQHQQQISSGPFVSQQHVKPTTPPSNPIECFYSIHLLLHSVPDLTTENLSEQYAAFYGWTIDARFSQLGGGSVARSLSMIPTLVSLTDVRTGQKLPTGRIADPNVVYLVKPIHPSTMTIAELKDIINQRPTGGAIESPQTAARPMPQPPPPEVAALPQALSQPLVMQAPPPRVVQPKLRGPAEFTQAVLSPEDLLVRGLHTLLQELHCAHPIGMSLDRNLGLPLAQLCDEFSKRTGIAMNAVALGHKNILE